jgi:type I restriction enzyme, S subunit
MLLLLNLTTTKASMADESSMTGWSRAAFGDVVRQVKDRTEPKDSGVERYVAGEHMDTDDLRIRRWGSIGEGYLGPAFHMRFKPGHVLYGSRRTYLRKVAVADFDGITANTTFVMEPKDPAVLLPELLPFVMQTKSFHEHSMKQSKGSVNPYINFSDLAWYEFDLPPLKEQRRIAATLRAALAVYETYANAHEHCSRTYASFVAATLESCQRHPQFRLSDVCTRIGVGIASAAAHAYRGSGVPMIRNNNILPGHLDTSDLLFLDPEFDEENRSKRVRSGDVLIARTGLPGAAAVVPPQLDQAQTFTTLVVTPMPDRLVPEYLCAWINSSPGRAFIAAHKGGGVQKNMNAGLLRNLPIHVPPLIRQCELVGRLQSAAQAKEQWRNRVQSARTLVHTLRESLIGRHR